MNLPFIIARIRWLFGNDEQPRTERHSVRIICTPHRGTPGNWASPQIVGTPQLSCLTESATIRHVTAEDLATVARTGSLDPLLEAVASQRLHELEGGQTPRCRTLEQLLFGISDDATTRTRDVLKDMTDTINDATAMLEARGRFVAAGIELATAQKRAALADARLDAAIAYEAARKMRHLAVVNSARLEEVKLDTAIAEQAALKAGHVARAQLEDAKLAASTAEHAAMKERHEAAARRAAADDHVSEMARRHRKELRTQLRAVRLEARQHTREHSESANWRIAHAEAEATKLRAEISRLKSAHNESVIVQRAEERGRAAAQETIDQLRTELEAARRRPIVHQEDEVAKAKRTLELERIRLETQKAQHEQQVAAAFLQRRVQGALDPDGARRRKANIQHRRELQRIAEELQEFTNDAERLAYAKRESNAYVQRAAEQYGEDSEEHEEAMSRADEFVRGLLDREEQ